MKLLSNDFNRDGHIPDEFTCFTSEKRFPSLSWVDLPAGTVSLALSVVDVNEDNFLHLLLYNIDKSINGINTTNLDSFPSTYNSGNKFGYYPLCPRSGKTHKYIFTLYALEDYIVSPDGSDNTYKYTMSEIDRLIIDKTTLSGVSTGYHMTM